ncbi:hypothetical protein F5884DRAFT_100611 [Xylogone sp. PMI_703]|nr:hypothetical protein F5884DRAFT_100611 [Xylogone sp. PMI_703]
MGAHTRRQEISTATCCYLRLQLPPAKGLCSLAVPPQQILCWKIHERVLPLILPGDMPVCTACAPDSQASTTHIAARPLDGYRLTGLSPGPKLSGGVRSAHCSLRLDHAAERMSSSVDFPRRLKTIVFAEKVQVWSKGRDIMEGQGGRDQGRGRSTQRSGESQKVVGAAFELAEWMLQRRGVSGGPSCRAASSDANQRES